MLKKFILSLSLVSIIAPVHGMWNGLSRGLQRSIQAASVAARMAAPRKVISLTPHIQVPKPPVQVAFKRSLAVEKEEKLKKYIEDVSSRFKKISMGEVTETSQDEFVSRIVDYCMQLTDQEIHHLIDGFFYYGNTSLMREISKKLCMQNKLPWSPSVKHMIKYYQNYNSRDAKDPLEVQELVNKLIDYSVEEEKKGNIVFFHAQGWQWQFFEYLNRELYKLVGKPFLEDHTALRFENFSLLDFEGQKKLAQNGVRQGENFHCDRWNGLFCNPEIYASGMGSNSVDYFKDNCDRSIIEKRNVQQEEDLFKAFGQEALFNKIKDNSLFQKLLTLHCNSSKYGNFVTIALPKELAKEIVYPSIMGGTRITQPNVFYKADGSNGPREFSCPVDLAENAHKTGFNTECIIALGKNIIDSEEAAKSGVKVRSWNLANEKSLALFKKVVHHLLYNIDDIKEREELEEVIMLVGTPIDDLLKDLSFLKKGLDKDVFDVNASYQNSGYTIFDWIIMQDKGIEFAKLLLEHGAQVTDQHMNSTVYRKSIEMVKFLLEHGVQITDQHMNMATSNKDIEMVKLLLEHGARVTEKQMGVAVSNNTIEMAKFLLEHGVQVTEKHMDIAVSNNTIEMVKFLLEHGVHVTDKQMDVAVSNNTIEMVKLLLEHGVQVTDKQMDVAVSNNTIEMVKLLLDHGAQVTEKHMDVAVSNTTIEIVKLLLEHGVQVTDKQMDVAVSNNTIEMAKLLLEHGAQVTEKHMNIAVKQMDVAVFNKNIEMVKLLLEHGAQVTDKQMDIAASNNTIEMVTLLLERGAQVTDKQMEQAVSNKNIEMVKLLLEHGASLNKLDDSGRSLFDCFFMSETVYFIKEEIDLLDLLLEHGVLPKKIDQYNYLMVKYLVLAQHYNGLKLLIGHGCNIYELMPYVIPLNIESVEFLLHCGADPNRIMSLVIERQQENKKLEMIEILLDHGADPSYGLGYIADECSSLKNKDGILDLFNKYQSKKNLCF